MWRFNIINIHFIHCALEEKMEIDCILLNVRPGQGIDKKTPQSASQKSQNEKKINAALQK